MLILIDADPIVYRCGFASETTSWHIVYEDSDGNTKEIRFNPDEERSAGDHMRSWLGANDGQITVLDKSRVVHPDPISYALRATKVQIEGIITACEEHYKQPCKMLMWISGKGGSYRDKIATVKPYKGNRDPTHKPVHYDAIRDYLRERYGSYITHGIEADDAVSIFAHNHYETGGESLVIATIDKDLDQIPGNHYNYMNKVFYAQTVLDAERFFVYQLLAGDDTDNIVGVWKCGDSAANRILADISKRGLFGGSASRSMERPTTSRAGESRLCKHNQRIDSESSGSGPNEDDAGKQSHDRQSSESSRSGTSSSAASNDASVHGEQRQLRISGDPRGNAAICSPGDDRSNPGSSDSGELRRSISSTNNMGSGGDPAAHSIDGGAATTSDGAAPEYSICDKSVKGGVPESRQHSRSAYEWWPFVVRAYADSQRKSGCPYAQANPEAVAIEQAQLVKLQEYPGQLWHPHGDLVVPGFGEETFDD